jgi:hypothetical protein
MDISEFKVIKTRMKTGTEVNCPVCGARVKPKCPFYAFCAFRLGEIGTPSICISHPEMCTFFKKQGGTPKINVKLNPSRRDEQDYEPI